MRALRLPGGPLAEVEASGTGFLCRSVMRSGGNSGLSKFSVDHGPHCAAYGLRLPSAVCGPKHTADRRNAGKSDRDELVSMIVRQGTPPLVKWTNWLPPTPGCWTGRLPLRIRGRGRPVARGVHPRFRRAIPTRSMTTVNPMVIRITSE